MMPINFTITAAGDPQVSKTKWYATPDNGEKGFTVGNTAKFSDGDGPHRGIGQGSTLKEVPRLYYDRGQAGAHAGLWAHFIWPTVVAESYGGHHLIVNTYDRARFTFGFYQLAAHTPDDNLILLFRELLKLPSAPDYFPELSLVGGKVHRKLDGKAVSLETVTAVHRPNGKIQNQIVGFMSFLNPDTLNVGTSEVLNAARLMHWLLHDRAAVQASEDVALRIVRRKVKSAAAKYGLTGHPVPVAIWVSDIIHQGRGSESSIVAALNRPTLNDRLRALSEIGQHDPRWDARRATVKKHIAILESEGLFNGVKLGSPQMPF